MSAKIPSDSSLQVTMLDDGGWIWALLPTWYIYIYRWIGDDLCSTQNFRGPFSFDWLEKGGFIRNTYEL